MSYDVGEATERLENEQSLILQPIPWLLLRHSSFSNLFRHFNHVTAHSLTLLSLHLRHSSFYSPYVASPTSKVLHLRHLSSLPQSKMALSLSKESDMNVVQETQAHVNT